MVPSVLLARVKLCKLGMVLNILGGMAASLLKDKSMVCKVSRPSKAASTNTPKGIEILQNMYVISKKRYIVFTYMVVAQIQVLK